MRGKLTTVCLMSLACGLISSLLTKHLLQSNSLHAQEIVVQQLAPIQLSKPTQQLAPVLNGQRTEPPAKVINRSQIKSESEVEVTAPSDTPHPDVKSVLLQAKRDDPANVIAPKTSADPLDQDDEWSAYTPDERANISVYEKNNRSVVNITTRTVRPDFFMQAEVAADGTGSGSVIDKQGHILTNLHVVEGAREIRVTLHNGEDYDAGVVGQDPVNDIAVLRIAAPAEELYPVSIGASDGLRVGQKIYAIGNPFGLDRTMTIGIVSSLNRTIPSRNGRSMKSIIQIDAALNQGNSGGPLLDSRGELIGMNTAIVSETGQNTGVGFAIPAGTIRRVVPQLIKDGRVMRASAGIAHVHPTEDGLLVAALIPGGPAEQAGVQGFRVIREQKQRGAFLYERTFVDRGKADLIQTVEGKPVETFDQLLSAIEEKQPGDDVTLGVQREGKAQTVRLQLRAEE